MIEICSQLKKKYPKPNALPIDEMESIAQIDHMNDQVLSGGCQCGAVRYLAPATPLQVDVCHCCECQKQSSSAFGISYFAKSKDVKLVKGTLKKWTRAADSGETVDCFFCAECGTRVWHGDIEKDDVIYIKGGSLDEPVDISNSIHVWTSRKLPGVIIPENGRSFDKEPE